MKARAHSLALRLGWILFISSSTGSGALAQSGPRWIELQSVDEIRAIDLDSDNDGILDWREEMLGTRPDSADSDADGFNDLFEDNYRAFGFDPLQRDSDGDGDGLTDTLEARLGTRPDDSDSDGDRLSDFDEVMNRDFGFDPNSPTLDQDFDGLADVIERELGTSPFSPDSNQDGVSDFQAYYEGIHPLEELEGDFGEVVGSSYSRWMERAIQRMRAGRAFPRFLAVELPYPAVTRRLYGRNRRGDSDPTSGVARTDRRLDPAAGPSLAPSAALLQSGVAASKDIFYATALYPTYNEMVSQLKKVASAFDGSPKPKIVRLFYWSEPTIGSRWIYALKISDNPEVNENEPEMLFTGLHHGRELISGSYAMELIRRLTKEYAAGDSSIQARVDTSEIWIIPIVNPDGYAMAHSEFAQGPNVNWRKNIRKVLELSTSGQAQTETDKGVDPNRNYDRSHISTLPALQRLALGTTNCVMNGLTGIGEPTLLPCQGFVTGSSTYGGAFGFSDIEARSVRMLADNQFLSGDEIDGLRCSLSWHTGGQAAILAPMNHDSAGTVSLTDQAKLANLGNAYSVATGFTYFYDSWWTLQGNYQAFGTSDDWLYTHNAILPLTVEGYPATSGPDFFPETFSAKKASVELNLDGAVAFMNTCAPLRAQLP